MNITGTGTLLTANTATLNALRTDGGSRLGIRITTNQPLTLRVQCSVDGTLYSEFPLAYVQSGADIVGQGIKVATSIAMVVDIAPFPYVRVLLDNASGSTATFTADAIISARGG